MLCSFNCFTKTVGIINYILRKQMMVQGTTRSSETCMLYLSESVINHVIFRRFPYIPIYLIFKICVRTYLILSFQTEDRPVMII